MPVPKATTENSPRRLLRDVVFEKMLGAIQDGTLTPGERLNDDELVQWLGVSRTPIREAIARLVEYGLVEMEANRYTRIATPTREQYDDALQLLFGITELAARWAFPRFDDDDTTAFSELLDTARAHALAEDRALTRDVNTLFAFIIARSGNDLLVKVSESIVPRTQFLALTASDETFWDVAQALDAFRAAATERDGEAGGAVLRAMDVAMREHVRNVRSAIDQSAS
ncbi:GntR family transcriptional regulator [Curtobacterium sp. RRHDQ10]|uniref:GntR family transcriptional regulator n=1 Tax=Curtobacterium phyllosphaerae TaxID=3413379 RepID=UPI003BF1FFA4